LPQIDSIVHAAQVKPVALPICYFMLTAIRPIVVCIGRNVTTAALTLIDALRRYLPLRPSGRGLYCSPAIWIGWLLQNALMRAR
jgi:hypothetical protein